MQGSLKVRKERQVAMVQTVWVIKTEYKKTLRQSTGREWGKEAYRKELGVVVNCRAVDV